MTKCKRLAYFFALLVFVFHDVNGQRAKESMYEQIKTSAACFRKMNATHQTGCTSSPSGSTGVVHMIESKSDLNFLLENGTAPPYIPVLPVNLFTHEIVHILKNSNKISGLIVFKKDFSSLTHYTHDLVCPNEFSNLDGTCKYQWNKFGSGLLFEDFPFPIFFLNNETYVQKIKDCFKKFNDFDYSGQYERSLCSLELSSFMFATTDTPTCMRRSNSRKNLNPVKFCDPLGDENVWVSLFPLENTTETSTTLEYIIVASRMDTTSFFNDIYPGAANPVTSLVTLIATANLLKKILPQNKNYDKNVLFVVFNGETYDYIGSQRMVYDMKEDAFPLDFETNVENTVPRITLEDISLFIELNQLSNTNKIVAHILNDSKQLTDFLNVFKSYGPDINFDQSKGVLPPASLQSFLKEKSNLNGLVFADHQTEYVNHFYNSIYDTVENIEYKYYNVTPENQSEIPGNSIQAFIANISTVLAKTLYETVTENKFTNSESVDVYLVDELFNCYLLDPNCKVHKAIQKEEFGKVPFGLYVGVSVMPNILTSLVGLTLGWLTGDIYELKDNKTCVNDPKTPAFQYFHMSKSLQDLNNTVCFRTTMNFTDAVSPAFTIPDYDWMSGKYSTWTESTWRDFNVRMYLKPPAAHERFTIALGSITFVLSLVLVYFIKNRSHILFPTPTPCAPTNC